MPLSSNENPVEWEAIYNAIPHPTVILGPDRRIISGNRRFEELLGKSKADYLGSVCCEIFHGTSEPPGTCPFDGSLKHGKTETADMEVELLGGYYIVSCTPVFDSTGRLDKIVHIATDITDRKKAEAELRRSEETFRIAFENAPTGMSIIAPNGQYLAVNPALCEMLGYSESELLAGTLYKITHPDDIERSNAWIKKVIAGDMSEPACEKRYLHKDGHIVWGVVRAKWVRNPDGSPRLSLAHIQDITQRKTMELAIAGERERLAVTLRSIGDGVIATDRNGIVQIMNKVAEELTGWKQSEALGKPLTTVFQIINELTRKPCENPVEKVLATGTVYELANHTVLIDRNGTERIIADSGAPITDKDSTTTGVVLVFRDMTEKQKMVDSMQRSDKLESLGILAGGIAHDFNNLLSGIFGYIDLAKTTWVKDNASDSVLEYLNGAISVFGRAKDLTMQLLTFSKGGEPSRKTGRLDPLVKECVTFALSGSQIGCDYAIGDDLWLCDYDKNQIAQVFDNIVINAQQAMPIGGKIFVAVSNVALQGRDHPTLKPGRYVRTSITDTGTGIPANLIKRIFDPFFTTKQKGNGLGLATCYSIIKKHDGGIEVESVPGKGSTFHVYLPTSSGTSEHLANQKGVRHAGSGTILVMDDEEFIRKVLGKMLAPMGYFVIEASDGQEAIDLCDVYKKKGDPIVGALFDLTIPGGMGGKAAIVEIRKKHPDLPVFASSGYSQDPVMAKPADFGFTASIRKPYLQAELEELLEKHLVRVVSP